MFAAGVFHHDGWEAGSLTAMHDREPTLTPGELGTIACRTLVVIGGDDEVRLEHAA